MASSLNLLSILEEAKSLILEVGAYIRVESQNFDRSKIEKKGQHDYVSYVDKTAEQKLVSGLSGIVDGAGFIVEENTVSTIGDRYNWVIDPLDGTTNFIHGLPCFAISVALTDDNIPVLGIIYEINLKECFYAAKGHGAWLNGETIQVSQMANLDESFIVTGFPYNNYGKLEPYLELLKYFLLNTRGIRRLGSASTDLAYVACGRFDGFYEYGLKSWDVAAGIIIIQEAGGIISDFEGGDNYFLGQEMVASNGKIHQSMQEATKKFMR